MAKQLGYGEWYVCSWQYWEDYGNRFKPKGGHTLIVPANEGVELSDVMDEEEYKWGMGNNWGTKLTDGHWSKITVDRDWVLRKVWQYEELIREETEDDGYCDMDYVDYLMTQDSHQCPEEFLGLIKAEVDARAA